eukprot:1141447-Pelagomonas_calceolata.AAC.1
MGGEGGAAHTSTACAPISSHPRTAVICSLSTSAAWWRLSRATTHPTHPHPHPDTQQAHTFWVVCCCCCGLLLARTCTGLRVKGRRATGARRAAGRTTGAAAVFWASMFVAFDFGLCGSLKTRSFKLHRWLKKINEGLKHQCASWCPPLTRMGHFFSSFHQWSSLKVPVHERHATSSTLSSPHKPSLKSPSVHLTKMPGQSTEPINGLPKQTRTHPRCAYCLPMCIWP